VAAVQPIAATTAAATMLRLPIHIFLASSRGTFGRTRGYDRRGASRVGGIPTRFLLARKAPTRAELRRVAGDVPEHISLARHRDLVGRAGGIWVRRAFLLLFLGIVAVALADVFGQSPDTLRASSAAATLEVSSPAHLRGGLLYEARFRVRARRDLKKAFLVLAPGWLEGQTINTIEPSPVGEASRDGALALQLGHVPAGQQFVLYMQFQVNPTNVGAHSHAVELDDGGTRLLSLNRTVTVFP
jgi:hypothetical protein